MPDANDKLDGQQLREYYRTGADAPLEALQTRYQYALFYFAWGLLGNEAEAEDALQDLWGRVIAGRGRRGVGRWRGGPGRSVRAWLYQVLRNLVVDRQRRGNVRAYVQLVSTDDEVADVAQFVSVQRRPEEVAELAEMNARLRAAIKALPRMKRMIATRKLIKGQGFEEIAAAVGMSVGYVYGQYTEILAVLEEELGDWL